MVYGVGPGTTLRFVPFNSKKAAPRQKPKPKENEWDIVKPPEVIASHRSPFRPVSTEEKMRLNLD